MFDTEQMETYHRLGSGVDPSNPEDALEDEQVGMMTSYRHQGAPVMTAAVRKTISLPPDLARDAEETARAEGKTLSAVVRDALRQTRAARLRDELGTLQDYWGRQAKERAILSEEDLRRYLET